MIREDVKQRNLKAIITMLLFSIAAVIEVVISYQAIIDHLYSYLIWTIPLFIYSVVKSIGNLRLIFFFNEVLKKN